MKVKLEALEKSKKNRKPLLIGIILSILFICIFLDMYDESFFYDNFLVSFCGEIDSVFIKWIFLMIAIAIIAMIPPVICLNGYEEEIKIRQKIMEYEIGNIKESIKEDLFQNSIEMSYKYLDQYYLQTREQAQRGFFITVFVSVFGAILIGIGIVAMFLEKTKPSYITCASGIITEFIASVFFYLYNRTVSSMTNYHNKLVLSQNISIALKVSDTLPDEEKSESKKVIISELLKDINTHLIQSDENNSIKN